jgi:hypothetical protein
MHCDDVPDFSNKCEPNVSTWVPPPEDWVKANVDAIVLVNPKEYELDV